MRLALLMFLNCSVLLGPAMTCHAASLDPCKGIVDKLMAADDRLVLERQSPSGDTYFLKYPLPEAEVTVSCMMTAPDVTVTWPSAKWPLALMNILGFCGQLVAGAPENETKLAAEECQALAFKSGEVEQVEKGKLMVECQAYSEDGGTTLITLITLITLYRR